jgi:hypothetical protein
MILVREFHQKGKERSFGFALFSSVRDSALLEHGSDVGSNRRV